MNKLESMGRAALLPGLLFAVEIIQNQIDEYRNDLQVKPKKKAKEVKGISYQKLAWDKKSPAEKKAWVKAVTAGKKKAEAARAKAGAA